MTWIIVLFLFFIAIAILKSFIKKKELTVKLASYQKKERVMNESEQALFINLKKSLGDEYVVLSKVRIEDFVEVKWGMENRERWGLRSRIKSRHVDFLICDRANTKPLFAIELDGKSHNSPSRQERDHFVDELYKAIELPIEHIHVGGNFLELAEKIASGLKNKK